MLSAAVIMLAVTSISAEFAPQVRCFFFALCISLPPPQIETERLSAVTAGT